MLLMACVKPYDFDPGNYEKVLVVDGIITDQPGPYQVSITYTYPLDTTINEYVTDATVWVEDSKGFKYTYSLTEDEQYQSPSNLQGVAGETYTLHIEMPNGDTYESSSQELRTPPAIADIYGKFAELPNDDDVRNVGGIQFFIDSEESTAGVRHFRYEWEEGYKIITPYPARYRVLPDSSIVYMDTTLGVCYKEAASNELIYGTSVGTTANRMVEFPVHFVSEELQNLRNRYSLLVRQFAISESAYLFYKRLEENNNSGGSLFDQQTGSIYGNIYSTKGEDHSVLGFFEVSGVTEKRVFFNESDFDDRLHVASFPYYCDASSTIKTVPDSALYYVTLSGGNIYYYDSFLNEVYIQSTGCTSCAFYASLIKPEYWTE